MAVVDDVLEGLRLQSSVFCRMTLSGDWGFDKGVLRGAPFHLLLSGQAWLVKSEIEAALELLPGDIVVLPRGEQHMLLSSPDAATVPFQQVADGLGLSPWVPGTRYKSVDLKFGSGSQSTTLISGIFDFGDHHRNPLIGALPSVLLTRPEAGSAVASITSMLEAELLSGKPGADSVSARLADILFIQIVRHHLASAQAMPAGWLRGLTDKEIAPPWRLYTARLNGLGRLERWAVNLACRGRGLPNDFRMWWAKPHWSI